MPKYKAIVTLGDGGRHVVYQEADSGYEANQILSTMYQQDVQAMAVFEEGNSQLNIRQRTRPRGNENFINPVAEAKKISRDVLVTTWNELVRSVIGIVGLTIVLIIFLVIVGIIKH